MLPPADRDLGSPGRRHILAAIAVVASLSADEIPAVLAHVEELRVRLWRRLLVPPHVPEASLRPATLMTVAEVADALRFSRGHVYELIRSGDLQAVKNGRAVRVTADALSAWQARHQGTSLDTRYSVSLDSAGDRSPGKAHSRRSQLDSVRVRETPRRPPRYGGEVGDGRPRDARPGRQAHRAPEQDRHDGGHEERPSATPRRQGASGS